MAIAVTARRDAVFHSKACRQAAHRARLRRADQVRDGSPMRFAYADPPYPGQARRYYGQPEVDHAALLSRLQAYDGWALSTSAVALSGVLAQCVAQDLRVRVAAWVRGPRPHATAAVLNGWEPVVYAGGRRVASATRTTDVLLGPTPRARATLPTYVIGAKPPAFCRWVFQLLGATVGDQLDDLFPGSGMVWRSWLWYQGLDPSREDPHDPSRRDVDARRLHPSRGSARDVSILENRHATSDATRTGAAEGQCRVSLSGRAWQP